MNSNKHVNETLRREYREANQYCELLSLWPTQGPEALVVSGLGRDASGVWLSKRWTPREQIHHIAQGANGADRTDVTSNLIAVCTVVHDWVGRYRNDGMALCMWAKIQKREWDIAEMNRVFGLERPGASVGEFIGRKGFTFPWVEPIWKSCKEWEWKQRKRKEVV